MILIVEYIIKMRRFLLLLFVLVFSLPAYADNRFSMILEYQLMDYCVGESSNRKEKITICACAMEKTQEDGWGFDYDHDGDYWEDEENFLKKFDANIKECTSD